jgi:hypothetical protein
VCPSPIVACFVAWSSSGCISIHLGLSESSGRVQTDLTEGSGPPQVALRGAALTCFPDETSEAALRDPANKHFAQRFVISVTEEVLPSRPSSIPSPVQFLIAVGMVQFLSYSFVFGMCASCLVMFMEAALCQKSGGRSCCSGSEHASE